MISNYRPRKIYRAEQRCGCKAQVCGCVGKMHLLTRPRQYHFFRLRARALSMATAISSLALTTLSRTSSPFCSIFSTSGSCCTTISFRSWNSCASSTICCSIF